MMRNLFTILIATLLTNSCQQNKSCSYINDYYQLVYLAEEAHYKGAHQKAYDLLTKASSNCKLLNQKIIYEMKIFAISAANIGENEKALELIKQLLLNGYDIHHLKDYEAFASLLKTKEWQVLENDYNELHQQYLSTINLDLRAQIADMTYFDQYYRKMLNHTTNEDSIWQLINKTDSINDLKLKAIIKKYGYPNKSIIGNSFLDGEHIDPTTLLFHFDDYEYYTSNLLQFVDEGKAPADSYGKFVDSYQRRVDSTKRYIYGIYENSISEEYIIEYDKLDERRVSVGLPPLALKNSIDKLKRAYYNFD